MLAPVFCLILAGAIDLGGMLYTRYGLDAAVSAGANYALIDAADVSSTSGASLANSLEAIVTSSSGSNWANSTIVVNNGPTVTTTGVGTTSVSTATSGTASNADSCYCPTLGSSGLIWGSAATCGGSCPSGGLAGKFVYITANRTYTPFFPSLGLVQNGTIVTSAMVQAQ
jgi:Flp pilus assembly protein TadG